MPNKRLPIKRLLILGGTGDAVALARELAERPDLEVITSLAGQTRNPVRPLGALRQGGFGGSQGLRDYLETETIDLVVDATHPFATTISDNAVAACAASGRPYLRLARPPWAPVPGDSWLPVASAADAAAALPAGARALVTVGRKELAHFLSRDDVVVVARMIEAPPAGAVAHCEILLARPPFSFDSEIELMRRRRIDHLVSKNSGGHATYAKIAAARALGLPVLMIARPSKPAARSAPSVPALVAMIDMAIQGNSGQAAVER